MRNACRSWQTAGRGLRGYCEDLGETLCPPDWAGIVDVTRRVAAESSFALAKGNVKGNGILGTPSQLTIPASRWSCDDLGTGCDMTRRKNNNATDLISRYPTARHPCPTSQHFITSGKRSAARHDPRCPTSHYREIHSPFDTPTVCGRDCCARR